MGVENYLRTDAGREPGFAALSLQGREELELGAIDYREDDVHWHRCSARDGETVTLHVYARPIERFHGFDERANRCFDVSATYDAVVSL